MSVELYSLTSMHLHKRLKLLSTYIRQIILFHYTTYVIRPNECCPWCLWPLLGWS